MTALSPSKSKHDREWAAKIAPLADEAADKAPQLLPGIQSDDFRGDSDSVLNLQAVAARNMDSPHKNRLPASAPPPPPPARERSLIGAREASVYAARTET